MIVFVMKDPCNVACRALANIIHDFFGNFYGFLHARWSFGQNLTTLVEAWSQPRHLAGHIQTKTINRMVP
jgi:hypothetical protein